MKVFLSWSKEPSKSVAIVLRSWLQDVIQNLEPWMSDQDIQSGERSLTMISAELQERDFGILVLTAENQFQPWINYEAGALSKMVGASKVVPFLFDFDLSNLAPGPLAQFHGREATREGTWRLMQDINAALPKQLSDGQLRKAFEKNWPDLENELKRIKDKTQEARQETGQLEAPKRTDSDKLDELLVMVREVQRVTRQQPVDTYLAVRGQRRSSVEVLNRKTAAGFSDLLRKAGVEHILKGTEVGEDTVIRIGVPSNATQDIFDIITRFSEEVLPPGTQVKVDLVPPELTTTG